MKRSLPLLLSLLLLTGCAAAVPAISFGELSAAPTATAEPQAAPPFRTYSVYDQPRWEELTAATMFHADLDGDGREEPVSFALNHENWTTAITWGESTVTLEAGDELVSAAVLDLDTASPFYNLLVVLDYGSDSYVTWELHPENGRLVPGPRVGGSWTWAEDTLWFSERTDFLGTTLGRRIYRGDDLVPDSEWLEMNYVPTAEEIEADRDMLIDAGVLLHTVRPVPCTVDGRPDVIPADTCVYRLRVRSSDDLAEVALPDGRLARIACTLGEHGWPYLIDGRDALDYFDNLFFAD